MNEGILCVTLRSIILGLLGALTVCSVTYFNDWVLRQTHFVGNNMPVSLYGMLIIFVLFFNRFLKRRALTGSELAVILTITLGACCVPGSGLLRTFPGALVLPHHYNRTEPAWREHDVLKDVPPYMLADVSRDGDRVLDGYVQGLSEGSEHISPAAVPWHAWLRAFGFWVPLALCMFLALVGLSVVVHRQWSEHEHLPYPIATFTDALLPKAQAAGSDVWHDRLFWIGLIAVFAIHLNNYTARWFPHCLIPVTLRLDFRPLARLFPVFTRGGGWFMFHPPIYFAVIGVSYFIATELAAAFGFGPCLWALVAGIFASYGISLTASYQGGSYIGIQPRVFMLFGACVGIFLSLLYTGRHYYSAVLRRALFVPSTSGDADRAAAWGARVFLAMGGAFVLQLCLRGGIEWQLATLYTAILVVSYIVSARLMAEGGLFHIKVNVFPCAMLWGLLGAAALGPQMLLLLQMLTMVLFIDPRETLMPFLANANKLLELRRVPIGRTCAIAAVGIVIGLAVALPITLYIQYDVPAATQGDRWAFAFVPRMPFENAVAVKQQLGATGMLDESRQRSGWERFRAARPVTPCFWGFIAGLALVLMCASCRMRFPWWPIHPLLFVVWAKSHIGAFAFSFILGWLTKTSVLRYGGNHLYNRLRPLMLGLIAGEILGAVVPSIVGAVYYFITNKQPISYILYVG